MYNSVMDSLRNPYFPGAGTPPPELAGRDEIRKQASIAIERLRLGRATRGILMVGPRGVGKTVLLERIRMDAESRQIHALHIKASSERSLPALLTAQLHIALLKFSQVEQVKDMGVRGLRALSVFVKALKVKYADIGVAVDVDPGPGLADCGNLEQDMSDLLETVGTIARKIDTAVALLRTPAWHAHK